MRFWGCCSPRNTLPSRYGITRHHLTGGSVKADISQMLWAFSLWLESVAILPQLFMLQRTGEAENITVHYVFALGIYRALYILNWIYRYLFEGRFDLIPVLSGVVQTVLYSDFFYIYYTKVMQGKKFNLPV